MSSSPSSTPGPKIIQWLLDTRPLWPVPKKDKPREEVQELRTVASRALALLTASEQESVLRYYHIKDAKMSLASHLLKHLIVTKYCNIPWSQSTLSRGKNGKPIWVSSSGHVKIDFNVSHQAGIVSMIAAVGFEEHVDVGTDVVCANERIERDHEYIGKSGFFDWIDMYADVFAESEVSFMKLGALSSSDLGIQGEISGYGKHMISRCQWKGGNVNIKVTKADGEEDVQIQSSAVIDAKIRRFYACWCLRETYVKMTGEALLAPWLKELEILDVQTPAAAQDIEGQKSLKVGNKSQDFAITFKGKPVTDVKMEVSAVGIAYMVGGALRTKSVAERPCLVMGDWQMLDFKTDVLAIAEANP